MDEAPQWTGAQASRQPAWGAVISMTLGVFGLVTAEFLPASLLTPMATDLGISEGMAGQAVTATALVGLVASLLISAATRSIDRLVASGPYRRRWRCGWCRRRWCRARFR